MRRLVFFLLRLSGLALLLREVVQHRRVSMLCYHDPKAEDFDRHLALLTRLYNVISLQQYLDYRRNPGARLPPKPLIITLDDGHRGNFRLREVILRHRVPVTMFLCSGVVGTRRHFWWEAHDDHDEMVRLTRVSDEERLRVLARAGFREEQEYEERQALSRQEIEVLKGFIDLQSHSRFHPVLPLCSEYRATMEIAGSKEELQRQFGLCIYALAFPNGDYSDREIAIAEKAGYSCAVTLDSGYNGPKTHLFKLHRMRVNDAADHHELLVKASGLWGFLEQMFPRRSYGYVVRTTGSCGATEQLR